MKGMDFRSVDSSSRNEIRKRAIKQINSDVQKKIVSTMYGVNPNTITNWVKKHKKDVIKIDAKEGKSYLIISGFGAKSRIGKVVNLRLPI